MLKVIRNHRRASYDATPDSYEDLTILPVGLNQELAPKAILTATHSSWDRALELGQKNGYRDAQVTVIAPTGTIALIMDCDTTGIEPDFSIVKFNNKFIKLNHIDIFLIKNIKSIGFNSFSNFFH